MKKIIHIILSLSLMLSFMFNQSLLQTQAKTTVNPQEFVSISVDKTEVKAFDTVTYTLKLSEPSKYTDISLWVVCPISKKEKHVNFKLVSDNTYQATLQTNDTFENGIWIIDRIAFTISIGDYIFLYNSNNNSLSNSIDLSQCDFNFSGGDNADILVPSLDKISISQNNAQIGDIVEYRIYASDDLSGIKTIQMFLISPETEEIEGFTFKYNNGYYTTSFEINEITEKGVWKIDFIYLSDYQSNEIYIQNSTTNKYGTHKIDLSHCDLAANTKVEQTISFKEPTIMMNINTTSNIEYTVVGVENPLIEWTSSNNDIVAVDQKGNIKALSYGNAIITAKLETGEKATCAVSVLEEQSFVMNVNESILYKSESIKLYPMLNGIKYEGDLKWKTSDSSIASVDQDGNITAHKDGIAYINVSMPDGTYALSKVIVCDTLVEVKVGESLSKTLYGTYNFYGKCYNPEIVGLGLESTGYSSFGGSTYRTNTFSFNGIKEGVTYIECRTTGSDTPLQNGKVKVVVHKNYTEYDAYVGEKYEIVLYSNNDEPYKIDFENEEVEYKYLSKTAQTTTISTNSYSHSYTYYIHKIQMNFDNEGTYAFEFLNSNNERIRYFNVNVKKAPVETIELTEKEITLNKNESKELTVKFGPEYATDKTVTWSSNDSNIASVDQSGKVTAKGVGTTTITVTTSNGKTASCKVAVKNSITSVTLDKTVLNLYVGQKDKLTASIHPSDTTDSKGLMWTIQDSSIVDISMDGTVTALNPGATTITVSTENNKTETCTVNVKMLPFYDVHHKKWYYPYVIDAYELGLMTGTTENTFAPDGNMTRGMVAVVMHRIAGTPTYSYRNIFPDVPAKKYCATAITWAFDNEIITGFKSGENAGKFLPDGNITRQDLALILYRYATSLGIDTSGRKDISTFVDHKDVSKYAREAIEWVTSVGIITGTKENELKPQANATRAECAKMLVEFYKLVNQ